MTEVNVQAKLKDENVVRLLGVCHEQPKLMVVEYMENGDLQQFLRNRKPDLKNCRTSQIGPNVLILDQLLYMAQQISAGMKYLHSLGFIHRDLATRNCLVGPAYQVKIADFGLSRPVYSKQYYRVEGKAVLPIRWMAPECLYYGEFPTILYYLPLKSGNSLSYSPTYSSTSNSNMQGTEEICSSCRNIEHSIILWLFFTQNTFLVDGNTLKLAVTYIDPPEAFICMEYMNFC